MPLASIAPGASNALLRTRQRRYRRLAQKSRVTASARDRIDGARVQTAIQAYDRGALPTASLETILKRYAVRTA